MKPSWQPREQPLAACALWVAKPMYSRLVQRLQRLSAARLARLQWLRTPQGVLVLGAEEQLPWLDCALWLGRDATAPRLLQPTLQQTDVPAPLLEQACLARTGVPTALIPPLAAGAAGTLLIPIRATTAISEQIVPPAPTV